MQALTEEITDQIGALALMTLGASTPVATPDGRGVTFEAYIAGSTGSGTGADTPRIMSVIVSLDINDTYTVEITHPGQTGPVTYFRSIEIHARQLSSTLMALDRGNRDQGARPIH